MYLVTGLFLPVLLLNQRWSPPLRLQASHCSTFRIMCDVPSIAVFCSESIECFPGTVSKFFFKLLVTIPVALVITGTIVHFKFHICCISIHKLLYFNFFSASFCITLLLIWFHLRLGLPRDLLSSEFLTKRLSCPMRANYPANLILHDVFMLILLGAKKLSYQSKSVIERRIWTGE